MGGDAAPGVVVEGAVQALRESDGDLQVLLVGQEASVRAELGRHEADGLPLQVVDAPEVIGMGEAPATALKAKPRSSIHIGLGAHRQGAADAFVSAGNTGAVMAAALFILGRLPGVARPALPGFFPATTGQTVLLVDVGANVDVRPEHLVQFGLMGQIYVERVLERENARVGLLNVGEEPGKGDELAKAAYPLLERAEGLRFIGNVEGRDVMHHAADVVVCDGFVGNVLLKFGESVTTVLPALIRAEVEALGLGGGETGPLLKRVLGSVMRRFSYEEFGGAPLLGVDGSVLIGHGGSSPRAIAQMIRAGAEFARRGVRDHIASALGDS